MNIRRELNIISLKFSLPSTDAVDRREKIHACVWSFKVALCKCASLKYTRFSQKKLDTFLTEWCINLDRNMRWRTEKESAGFHLRTSQDGNLLTVWCTNIEKGVRTQDVTSNPGYSIRNGLESGRVGGCGGCRPRTVSKLSHPYNIECSPSQGCTHSHFLVQVFPSWYYLCRPRWSRGNVLA